MNEHLPTKAQLAKRKPKRDYQVGYCRPPAEHRFKPGNNANPRGRRKGSKNRKVVIQDVLLELIEVREGGERKQMTKLEALLKKTMSDALAGDKKAALTIFGIAQKEGLLAPEQVEAVEGLAEDDAAIIEAYNRRVRASPPLQADKPATHSWAEIPAAAEQAETATGQKAKAD
jgi:Family of unknown function (DUF5681)